MPNDLETKPVSESAGIAWSEIQECVRILDTERRHLFPTLKQPEHAKVARVRIRQEAQRVLMWLDLLEANLRVFGADR